MAYQWTVIVLDLAAGGAEQDVSAFWDATASSFQPIAHYRPQRSFWRLSFPATTPLNIREGFPYMAGNRDPATREWDASAPVYCGTIGKQTGGAAGARHILTADLDDWSVTFDDTALIYWPGSFGTTYPGGFTVGTWLSGTSPYLGLLPSVYDDHKVDFSGIDFNLAFVTIPTDHLPCAGASLFGGVFAFCSLREAIDAIILTIRLLVRGTDPVAWMEPCVAPRDPTQIIPRFRLIDRNGVLGTVVATFAVDPVGDEWRIEQPFTHERDMRPAKQRIIVQSDGVPPFQPPQWVDYSDPDHLAAYPTYLQRSDAAGRALILRDNRIATPGAATAIAQAVEALIYGPLGRITFRTTRPTRAGELIAIRIPQEGQDNARFVVADVQTVPNVGRPLYEVTVGAPTPDFRQLLETTVHSRLNLPLTAGGTLSLGLDALNLPAAQNALDTRPSSYTQNAVQARWRDVPGHTVVGTDSVRPGSDPITTVWAPTTQVVGGDGLRRNWTDKDGVHHPIGTRMQFTSDGSKYFNAEADYHNMTVDPLERSGTSGETLAYTVNGAGVGAPFSGLKGDRIGVTAAFVTGGTPFAITVREAYQVLVLPP